jgi:ketosteroid isomerase-like protein
MSFQRFDNWLGAYKQAWETRDPDAAESLFTEDATYQVTPFTEPNQGRQGIRNYWSRVTTNQRDVRFGFQMLATNGDTGVARWNVVFTEVPEGVSNELDGIFVFTLTPEGRCQEFKEWWHILETR